MAVCVNQVLKSYSESTRCGAPCDLDAILREIENNRITLQEGNKVSIIQIMCHLGRSHEAYEYLHKNGINRLGAYIPIIYSFLENRYFDKVIRLRDELLNKNIALKQDNYFTVMTVLLENRQFDYFDIFLDDFRKTRNTPELELWKLIHKRFQSSKIVSISKNGNCPNCNTILEKIDCPESRKIICSTIEKKIRNREEWKLFCSRLKNFTHIVDGANIGRFDNHGNLEIDYKKIIFVSKQIKSNGVLIVLHENHNLAIKRLLKLGYNVQIVPKGHDDDWFTLYAALKLDCQIVSNDLARNHGYSSNCQKDLQWWLTHNQIKLEIVKNEYKLRHPPSFSTVIQNNHIPNTDGKWICCTNKVTCA